MVIYEVEHACVCGHTWRAFYEAGAVVSLSCPTCNRVSELVNVGAVNHPRLEERPTSKLITIKETG